MSFYNIYFDEYRIGSPYQHLSGNQIIELGTLIHKTIVGEFHAPIMVLTFRRDDNTTHAHTIMNGPYYRRSREIIAGAAPAQAPIRTVSAAQAGAGGASPNRPSRNI